MTNNHDITEKFNAEHSDYKWFMRVTHHAFFIGGTLLSAVVLFFIIYTETGRTLASNPVLREFILNTFPSAVLWMNSTVNYPQEIVLIYFYHVLLLLWGGGIIVYLYVLNWRRMLVVQKIHFAKLQVEKNLCTFKTLLKFTLLLPLLLGLIFGLGFGVFEPYLTPMAYEDYHRYSGRGIDGYEIWNTYPGLLFMFMAKIHMTFFLILLIPLTVISMLMCFKKNTFHTPN